MGFDRFLQPTVLLFANMLLLRVGYYQAPLYQYCTLFPCFLHHQPYIQQITFLILRFFYLLVPLILFLLPGVLTKTEVLNISLFKLTTAWTLCLRCDVAHLDSEFILLVPGCVEKPTWPLRAMLVSRLAAFFPGTFVVLWLS